jgi:hypothetical protein
LLCSMPSPSAIMCTMLVSTPRFLAQSRITQGSAWQQQQQRQRQSLGGEEWPKEQCSGTMQCNSDGVHAKVLRPSCASPRGLQQQQQQQQEHM